MKINRINLGEIIRQIVTEKGMSDASFAKEIGMQRQNVKKMVFEGVEVAVPNNPDGVLRSMYGDYMEMPQLADRKPHFDKVIFLNKKQ